MNVTDKVQEIRQEGKTSGDSDIYDDFLQAMFDIDEIDIEVGLSYANGLRDRYFDIVKIFHLHLVTEWEKMTTYLRDGDINVFYIFVHGMKSVLASVGAVGLSKTAFQLETALKNDDTGYCKEHFPAFIESLLIMRNKLSLIFLE